MHRHRQNGYLPAAALVCGADRASGIRLDRLYLAHVLPHLHRMVCRGGYAECTHMMRRMLSRRPGPPRVQRRNKHLVTAPDRCGAPGMWRAARACASSCSCASACRDDRRPSFLQMIRHAAARTRETCGRWLHLIGCHRQRRIQLVCKSACAACGGDGGSACNVTKRKSKLQRAFGVLWHFSLFYLRLHELGTQRVAFSRRDGSESKYFSSCSNTFAAVLSTIYQIAHGEHGMILYCFSLASQTRASWWRQVETGATAGGTVALPWTIESAESAVVKRLQVTS